MREKHESNQPPGIHSVAMVHHPNQQKATLWNNVARAVVSKGFFRVADNVIYKGRKKDGKRRKMKVTFKDG